MPTPPLDLDAVSFEDLKKLVVQLLVEVTALREENRQLREDIARLKDLPKKPQLAPGGMDKASEPDRRASPDYSRRRWVWREPVSGRRVWLSTPIRAPGAPTHRDARYACPAQPVTDW